MKSGQVLTKLVLLFLILIVFLSDSQLDIFVVDASNNHNCSGEWSLRLNSNNNYNDTIGYSQDRNLSVTMLNQIDQDCEGSFTVSNLTGSAILSGHSYQLFFEKENATIYTFNDLGVLLPNLPIDYFAAPTDSDLPAIIKIQGRMTELAYLYDFTFITIMQALNYVPNICPVSVEVTSMIAQRTIDILKNAAFNFLQGNYETGYNEFIRVFDTFIYTIEEEFRNTGIHCIADVAIDKILGKKAAIVIDVIRWLAPWYSNYFKHEFPYLTISYILNKDAVIKETPTPEPTPTTGPVFSFYRADPNYVYSQVKETIKHRDVSYLKPFVYYPLEINSSSLEACSLFEGWEAPPLEAIEDHIGNNLKCLGIQYEANKLAIYYSGWDPDWIDCSTNRATDIAGFLFLRSSPDEAFKFRRIQSSTMETANLMCCGRVGVWPYNLIPCDVDIIPDINQRICPGAPPQRLRIGQKGAVCTKSDAVTLRDAPGKDQKRITALAPGTEFTVVSGPYCAGDNWSWYYINVGGMQGYISEGGDSIDEYFLCPLESAGFQETPTAAVIPTPIGPNPRIDYSNMVYVPAGEFLMGCDTKEDPACFENWIEHKVYLDSFYIDKYEVTNKQYQECVDMGVCNPPVINTSSTRRPYYGNPAYEDYPVVNVNHQDAETYCAWWGKRLPTEAEWEKAARGNTSSIYPWSNNAPNCDLVNFDDKNCYGDTVPVQSYPEGASPYGVYNMAGNVQEWVKDCFDDRYYLSRIYDNPVNLSEPCSYVVRGGGWSNNHKGITTYMRGYFHDFDESYKGTDTIGFRCATDGDKPSGK